VYIIFHWLDIVLHNSSQRVRLYAQHTGCTALSAYNTLPSGVFCRWTNRLEVISRRAQRWDWEHFPAVTEKTAFQTILVCSAP